MIQTDRFSPARTISLAALYISENRRTLLLRTGLVVGALICLALFNLPYDHSDEWPAYDCRLDDMAKLYYFVGVIFACVGASLMADDLRNRQGRIRLLMRPAPMTEKYIARWLIYVVGFVILYFLAVAIADAVRVALAAIFYPDYHVCYIFNALTGDTENANKVLGRPEYRATLIEAITAIYFLIQSFFVLGSTIWYRTSFIKTFIVFGAITAIYFGCIIPAGDALMSDKIWPEEFWIKDNIKEVMLTAAAVATVFNWALGCWRLHETDVITTRR